MTDLIKPSEVIVKDLDGKEWPFTVSRMPAVQGREIVAKYPMSALPKLGDYGVNEDVMLKMLSFVAVKMPNGELLRLTTRALVDNHTHDWECLAQVEWKMLEYNTSFFRNGALSTSLSGFAQTIKQWILSTLTDLSAASSRRDGQA